MELRQYLAVIWKWLWLIILGTGLAAGTSFAVSASTVPVYQASTTLLISQASTPALTDYTSILTSERLAKTYGELLKKRPVMEEVIRDLGLAETSEKLAKRVNVRLVRDTQLIELNVEDTDPQVAAQIANRIPEVFIKKNQEIQASRFAESKRNLSEQLSELGTVIKDTEKKIAALRLGSPTQPTDLTSLEANLASYRSSYSALLKSYEDLRVAEARSTDNVIVAERAQVPKDPVRPRKALNTLLAGAVGMMLAVGVAFLIEYLDDTIKTPADVSQSLGLSTMAAIARIQGDRDEDKLIAAAHPKSPISEAYRVLRTNLQFATMDKALDSLLVTSPNPVEGKSITVANLGIVMAQAGLSVIIVDSDLRRPMQHRLFHLSNAKGFTNALVQDGVHLDDCLQATALENLRVLTSGPLPPNPSELLGSPRMDRLVELLKTACDIVIFDSSPTLAVTDAAILATKADATLLVLDAGATRRELALKAKEQLTAVGAHLLGVALNRVSPSGSNYYYYYYYSSEGEKRQKRKTREEHAGQAGLTGWLYAVTARLLPAGRGGQESKGPRHAVWMALLAATAAGVVLVAIALASVLLFSTSNGQAQADRWLKDAAQSAAAAQTASSLEQFDADVAKAQGLVDESAKLLGAENRKILEANAELQRAKASFYERHLQEQASAIIQVLAEKDLATAENKLVEALRLADHAALIPGIDVRKISSFRAQIHQVGSSLVDQQLSQAALLIAQAATSPNPEEGITLLADAQGIVEKSLKSSYADKEKAQALLQQIQETRSMRGQWLLDQAKARIGDARRALAEGSPVTAQTKLLEAKGLISKAQGLDPAISGAYSVESEIKDLLAEAEKALGITYLGDDNSIVQTVVVANKRLDTGSSLQVFGSNVFVLAEGTSYEGVLSENVSAIPLEAQKIPPDVGLKGELADISLDTDGLYVLDKTGNIARYSLPERRWSRRGTAPPGRTISAVALDVLGNTPYVLDSGQNQIWRYGPTTTPYFDDRSSRDLQSAVDLAVDGNVYVLSAGGEVQKFDGAKPTKLALPSVVPVPSGRPGGSATLGKSSLMVVTANTKNLYLIDRENQRIVAVDKNTGQYRHQYLGIMGFNDLKGLFVIPGRKMYILSDGRLYIYPKTGPFIE